MIKEILPKLVEGKNLTREQAREAMKVIMEGKATPAQIGAFLTALRMKGETVEEITGFAEVMREKAVRIDIGKDIIVDTCGTGGDSSETFNISTVTAFVVAGGGLTVAKHGNRSVSSKCGSADVMEALGINIQIPPPRMKECLETIGIGFLFAPLYHLSMKYALPPRREMGIRTVFNILGPLTNPAGANIQVMGVFSPHLTEKLAGVLMNLGSKQAYVVWGEKGYDEITTVGSTKISYFREGKVETFYLHPEEVGIRRSRPEELKGGTPQENAQLALKILKGERGAPRDIVLINSAACFVASGKARDWREGINMAEESIDSGKALEKLQQLREFTTRV